MAVTRVAYTAEGWGDGELWFDGPRLVWHELPHPRAAPVGDRPSGAAEGYGRANGDQAGTHPHPSGRGSSTRLPLRATLPAKSTRDRTEFAPDVDRLLDGIHRYFEGERVDFHDVELDLEGLTPFQRAVARALRNVPYGAVVSYGDLARSAGYPNAQRAAGTFCAHNRYPLVLPCHRVVAATGLGSYGSLGLDYKRRLLKLEHVAV